MDLTEELARRQGRAADYARENRALTQLAHETAQTPQRLLQTFVDVIVGACRADAAGISMLEGEHGQEVITWRARAGEFPANIPQVAPRRSSPCDGVIEHRATALLHHLHRSYAEFASASPLISEALLVPFGTGAKPVGAVWLILFQDNRQFDSEDARIANSLTDFAGDLFQLLASQETAIRQRDAIAIENDLLREAHRQKSERLTIIGHELRTPLSGMQYTISYLSRRHAALPDLGSALNLMERQLKSTTRLVEDLFEASKLTRGNVQLIVERIDLSSPVAAAVEANRKLMEKMQHELTVTLPPEPVMLNADPARLTQIVSNLLDNAAKYTPAGGHVEVSARRDGQHALIRVADDGIGIPREMLDQIFEMFAQGTRPGGSAHEGLGIGLGVVKELVKMHGGKVEVRSEGVGRGSEFLVMLPTAD